MAARHWDGIESPDKAAVGGNSVPTDTATSRAFRSSWRLDGGGMQKIFPTIVVIASRFSTSINVSAQAASTRPVMLTFSTLLDTLAVSSTGRWEEPV